MKYSKSNPPLVCMMTQSTCYKGTTTMTPKGVLWHSTGANNPTLKRYVQPSDGDPKKAELIKIIGKNQYGNDWNHITRQAGLNCWIGKLADGTVATVQTLPWNYKPWGCGSGSKGSCNNGWMQFEICEDGLTNKDYFNAVYKEACEITAYYCQMYSIDPKGTVTYNGVKVPTILCHQDSYKLGLGGNHSDVYHWFNKHGKTMDDVRNDVAKLLGESAPATPTTVKTYKVVVDISTYANAADAKAKKNKKGTYKAGNYYIYNKYPIGVDGMFNISNDKTGNSAGAWINPSENVAPQPVEDQMYRVRKTWADSKSQKGAFKDLNNAKACCQEAGPGYNVFDKDGKIVYSYIELSTPEIEQPKTDTLPKKVYELQYPVKHKICEYTTLTDIGYQEEFTKCCEIILKNNPSFDIEIVKAFFKLAPIYGIDATRAISQSILETGWFKYSGSAVKPEHHNYCGLGVTVNGKPGNVFDTIENGVRAQLQHLFAYGSKDALPQGEQLIDERFKYVTRGIAATWEELAGRWAVPGFEGSDPLVSMQNGTTYGQKIDKIYQSIIGFEVSKEIIKKYFDDVTPAPVDPENQEQDIVPPIIPITPEDVVDPDPETSTDLITLIFNCFKKLIVMIVGLFNKSKGE